jgi:hypothetical protein
VQHHGEPGEPREPAVTQSSGSRPAVPGQPPPPGVERLPDAESPPASAPAAPWPPTGTPPPSWSPGSGPGGPAAGRPAYPPGPGPGGPAAGRPAYPAYPPYHPYPPPAYPGPPPYPPAPPGPPRRRRWGLWICLGLVAVLLVCVLPAALVVGLAIDLGSVSGVTDPTPGPTGVRSSPGAARATSAASAAMREKISAALTGQSAALLAGDQTRFVAVADPSVPSAVSDLKRRFRTLRALRVTRWSVAVDAPQGPTPNKQWSASLRVRYCIVVATCRVDPVDMGSTWVERGGRALLVRIAPSRDDDNGPLPWEVSDLRVAIGKRTVIATTQRYASRLPTLLQQAERAATAVAPFVIVRPPPDRYRIYYAGPAEWDKWYGGGQPEWSVGRAVPVPGGGFDVVLNAQEVNLAGVGGLLRHELTHVATLRGAEGLDDWWLVEGIAEYVQMSGRPLSQYDGLEETRRWVDGGWDGDIAVDAPRDSTPEWQVGARYGVAFLAVRCIADRFGRDKMIEYFAAVKNSGQSARAAAESVLDEEWGVLAETCSAYVRNAL